MSETQRIIDLIPEILRPQLRLEVLKELNEEKLKKDNEEYHKYFNEHLAEKRKEKDANKNNDDGLSPAVKKIIEDNLNKNK